MIRASSLTPTRQMQEFWGPPSAGTWTPVEAVERTIRATVTSVVRYCISAQGLPEALGQSGCWL